MRHLLLITALLIGIGAQAKSKKLDSDMDALGGNQDLIERANAIDPRNTTRIVQKREVDRYNRIELGINYGMVGGGDPYVNTNNLGAQLEYHIDPHWSFGARYYQSANSLSSEGKRVFNDIDNQRSNGVDVNRPDVDYAKNTWMGTITFYPFYGKLNLADLAITQFDIYFLGGAGQITTANGSQPTYAAGGGLAFWMSQHFSTRLEARYQGYHDKLTDGTSRQLNLVVLQLGIGVLL